MLITDEVLGSCLHTGGLVTLDGLVHADTGEVGVGGETLPVAARVCGATQRAGNGAIGLSVDWNVDFGFEGERTRVQRVRPWP